MRHLAILALLFAAPLALGGPFNSQLLRRQTLLGDSCSTTSDCGDSTGNVTCTGGICTAEIPAGSSTPIANGGSCTLDAGCSSGWCSNAVCADRASAGTISVGAHCLTTQNCFLPATLAAATISCGCPATSTCDGSTDSFVCIITNIDNPTTGSNGTANGESCRKDADCTSLACIGLICVDPAATSGILTGQHCLVDAMCAQSTSGSSIRCSCPSEADCSAPATDSLTCLNSAPVNGVSNGGDCASDSSCLSRFCQAGKCVDPTDSKLAGTIAEGQHCPSGGNSTCVQPTSSVAACLCPSSSDCSTTTDAFVCSSFSAQLPPSTPSNSTDGLPCGCPGANPAACTSLSDIDLSTDCAPAPNAPRTLQADADVPDPGYTPLEEPSLSDDELDTFKTLELQALSARLQEPIAGEKPIDLPYCTYEAPTQRRKKRAIKFSVKKIFKNLQLDLKRPKPPVFPPNCPSSIKKLEIGIQFNVIGDNATVLALITEDVLNKAMDEMNVAYRKFGITWFRTGTVRRRSIVGSNIGPTKSLREAYRDFASCPRDYTAKSDALYQRVMNSEDMRRGIGNDVMNVFLVQRIVTKSPTDPTKSVAGFCGGPTSKLTGCIVAFDSISGVSFDYADESGGKTLAHEAGHWLGLEHVFDNEGKAECTGINRISTIPQFLYSERKAKRQHPCTTKNAPFFPLDTTVKQVNWMSYSPLKGTECTVGVDGCKAGLDKPWVPEQFASAFAQFYQFRRASKVDLRCFKYGDPARSRQLIKRGLAPEHPDTPSLYQRLLHHRQRVAKRDLLAQRPNVVEELTVICQTPYTPPEVPDPILAAVLPDAEADIRAPAPAVDFSISGGVQTTLSDGRIQINLDVPMTTTDDKGTTVTRTSAMPLITREATTAIARLSPTSTSGSAALQLSPIYVISFALTFGIMLLM